MDVGVADFAPSFLHRAGRTMASVEWTSGRNCWAGTGGHAQLRWWMTYAGRRGWCVAVLPRLPAPRSGFAGGIEVDHVTICQWIQRAGPAVPTSTTQRNRRGSA